MHTTIKNDGKEAQHPVDVIHPPENQKFSTERKDTQKSRENRENMSELFILFE